TDGITHIKFYPAKKDGTPDKDQQPIATGQVKDGAKGDKGEKGQDGTTTIKFYPVDPKTGKPDTTQPAVAEGSVKDG
ncbi:LPXTG cell wall anchor domain-containing protein, partial [Streptococcus anginosus]|nr:LPXTG cell wall anchor domain-containing protein [Streptococcus anginosus]